MNWPIIWGAITAVCAILGLLFKIVLGLSAMQRKLDSKLSISDHVTICEKHDAELKETLKEIKATLASQDDASDSWRSELGKSMAGMQTKLAVMEALSNAKSGQVLVNTSHP